MTKNNVVLFRFKQFTIQQDRTAMKVCTDACILGAYANVGTESIRLLDIGTGTGLLVLMTAQRNRNAQLDAVEIDEAAFNQASENVANSPFSDRIKLYQTSIQAFAAHSTYKRILTNPPFYTNHLRSPDAAVNRALHTDDLPFNELVAAIKRLLHPDGQWWVLLPPYEMGILTELAATIGLQPFHELQIRHHANKPVFRHVTGFSYQNNTLTTDSLAIYETDGRTYTAAFRALLKDFYLIF